MKKKFPSDFWVLTFVEFLMVASYSLSFPFLAIYLNQHKNISIDKVGAYLSLINLISSFSNILGGYLSDYFGRKKIMVLSFLLRGLFIGLMSFLIFTDSNKYFILLIYFLASISSIGFPAIVIAYISEIIEFKNQVRAYSILRIATNLGWALGPAIGGYIALKSYSLTFAISSALFFLNSLILWRLLKKDILPARTSDKKQKILESFNFSTIKNNPAFLNTVIFTFLMSIVIGQLLIPVSLYSKNFHNFNEKQIGFLFTVNGSIVILLQYFIGNKLKTSNLKKYIYMASLLYGTGYLLFGFSVNYAMAVFSFIIITLGEIMFDPSLSTLTASLSPEKEKGKYIGIYNTTLMLGKSSGVLIGTFLMHNFSNYYKPAPWILIFLISLSAVLFLNKAKIDIFKGKTDSHIRL